MVEGEGLRLGWYWFKYKLKVFFKKYTLQPDESVKVSTFPQKHYIHKHMRKKENNEKIKSCSHKLCPEK